MVVRNRGRQTSPMTLIKRTFRRAKVPEYLYSFAKEIDNRVCIFHDYNGFHVFIPDRGKRTGERVFDDWYKAVCDAANCFELKYTEKILRNAKAIKMGFFASHDDNNWIKDGRMFAASPKRGRKYSRDGVQYSLNRRADIRHIVRKLELKQQGDRDNKKED